MIRNKQNDFNAISGFLQAPALMLSVESVVLQALRDAITKGGFYPGQAIDENAVAKELQVSRMPVRQAISALEVEGLVTKLPRKGTFVTSLDENDIREIYTMRMALEEVAITEAVKHYCEEDYEKLDANVAISVDEMESYHDFLEIDKDFHRLLYAPSGWNRLTRVISQLRNNTSMYRWIMTEFPKERIKKSIQDHKAILEACKRRDTEEAVDLLKAHTQKTILRIEDLKGRKGEEWEK
jgi:Transcriptional regulators